MVGWQTGMKKCPSIFFLLYAYTDYVYIYLYMSSKFVTDILMGLKILWQVGVIVDIVKTTAYMWLLFFSI